jgi:hypothetical protein
MLFVDYVFEKAGKNILFDKELNPDMLDVKSGDMFVAKVDENNRLVLVKIKDEAQ